MKIIWLGHGSFRLETGKTVILIDPWLTGNPTLSEDQHADAIEGATHILCRVARPIFVNFLLCPLA